MTTSLKTFLRWLSALFTPSLGLLTQTATHAATNIVLAGEDLQPRINAAASGDVMVVQSGTYAGDITINKPLAFVRSGSGDLQILGPVSINTSGTVSFHQYRFSDRVFVAGNADLTLVGSHVAGLLGSTDGSCLLRQTSLQLGIQLTNANLTMLRCTNAASINAFAPTNSNRSVLVTQSQNGELNATGYSVHCGYSTLTKVSMARSRGVIVGNLVTGSYGPTIECNQSTLFLRNNFLRSNANQNYPGQVYGEVFNVAVVDSQAVIENNTLISIHSHGNWPHPFTSGILLSGDSTDVQIVGNIIRLNNAGYDNIRRLGNGRYNIAYNHVETASLLANNATVYAMFNGDAKINADGTLAIDSPCRNAGPPDAIYNDRDGTRNDIGFTGGPLYNPALATTDLPIAFWLDAQPRRVLKGVQNTIRIEAAGAAGF